MLLETCLHGGQLGQEILGCETSRTPVVQTRIELPQEGEHAIVRLEIENTANAHDIGEHPRSRFVGENANITAARFFIFFYLKSVRTAFLTTKFAIY